MTRRMTVAAYLAGEETNRPQELAYGILREPAAPSFHHQIIVGRISKRLDRHACRYAAGVVVASPVDVILDLQNHLVVQPDIVFVRSERLGICTDRIWGAPDLVIEVLSMGNSRRDRTVKVEWYRKYGVPECWLVDAIARTVEVVDLQRFSKRCSADLWGEPFRLASRTRRVRATEVKSALAAPERRSRTFEQQEFVRSSVLPRLRLRPASLFDE